MSLRIGRALRAQASLGETSFIVAEKFAAARAAGLIPILCLGESGAARQARRAFEVIAEELDIVIEKNGAMAFDNAIIAYEPIWAVGTGKCATPEQAQEVHSFIRGRLAEDTPVEVRKSESSMVERNADQCERFVCPARH